MMQYIGRFLMLVGLFGGLFLTSCSKDVFNEDDYNDAVKKSSPVDSVDAKHTWELTQDHVYVVEADANVDAKAVYILTGNPLTELSVEVMAQTEIEDGGRVMLAATVPTRLSELYAALVDANGLYTVVSFPIGTTVISFANVKSINKQKALSANTHLVGQKLVYCFEEEIPEPGDHDYNDVVLRLSREVVNSRHLKISVELAAVGGKKQLAAGLRLVGYKAEDIDSVTIEGGGSFDMGGSHYDVPLKKMASPLFGSSSLLQSGRNGEAVIYLFEDAHWAMGDDLDVTNQIFERKRYNVSKLYGDNYMILPTRTETYHVYFKVGQNINGFTPSMFDPFVVSPYYSTVWEIHCYRDRDAQVMHEYTLANSKNLPWALMIPYAAFRYPLDGVNIGFYKNGALFGAYMNMGCSFGEWAEDCTKCLDWYTSPTSNQVF